MNPDEVSLRPPSRLSPLQASVWRHSVAEMLQSDAIEVFVSFKAKTFLLARGGSLESRTNPDWTKRSTLRVSRSATEAPKLHEFRETPDLWGEGIEARRFRAKSIHKAELGKDPGITVELFELTGLATTSDYCRPSFGTARALSQRIVHIALDSADPQIIYSTDYSPEWSGPLLVIPELNEGHRLIWDYGWKYFFEESLFLTAEYLIVVDGEDTYLFSKSDQLWGLPFLDLEEIGVALEEQPEVAPSVFNPPIAAATRDVLSMFRAEILERDEFLTEVLRHSDCSFEILDVASVNPLRETKSFPRWENVFTHEELKAYMANRAHSDLESQEIAVMKCEKLDSALGRNLGEDGDDLFISTMQAGTYFEVRTGEVVFTATLALADHDSKPWAEQEYEATKRFLELVWPKNWLAISLQKEVFEFDETNRNGSKWKRDAQGNFLSLPRPGLPVLNRWITPDRVRLKVGPWEWGGLSGSGLNYDESRVYEEVFSHWDALDLQNIDPRQFLKRLASQVRTRGLG